MDLNNSTFNEKTGYHIVPEFGPQGGYLEWLSSEIKGNKFHNIGMIHDRMGQYLLDVVVF